MEKKKILIIAFCLFLVLASGCTQQNSNATSNGSTTSSGCSSSSDCSTGQICDSGTCKTLSPPALPE